MGKEDELFKDLAAVLKNTEKEKEISGLGLQSSPEIAAVISKLHRPVNQEDEQIMSAGMMQGIMLKGVNEISKQQMGRKENSHNSFKLFPDLELVAQIVITSILSPKDMLTSKLNYRLDGASLPVAAVSEILDLIRGEMNDVYKLDDSLYDIIHDALFSAGSYPYIVLPESAVDAVINEGRVAANETAVNSGIFKKKDFSEVKSLGILGDPHDATGRVIPGLESSFTHHRTPTDYNEKLFIHGDFTASTDEDIKVNDLIELAKKNTTVTDNYDILRLPELIDAATAERMSKFIKTPITIAAETSDQKVSANRLFEMLYKKAPSEYVPFSSIPSAIQLKRRSVGRPAILRPGSEAVIPIFLPGEYDNHIAYFLATDVDGHPVTLDGAMNEFSQGMASLGDQGKAGASASNSLTDRAKRNLITDDFVPQVNKMAEFYAQIIEKDLLERLSRGVMGKKNIEIKISNELSRTMLARAWKGRATRVVFVPGEYVTYFAYDYHRNGVGKSYLDDLSNVIGLRAMVLFSSVWARVRSSISTIDTHVVLDPRDTDPVKTIELAKHLVAKSRQQYFPNGLQSVQDFTSWLHNAGIRVTWEGHPALPATTITSESKNIDHVQPDDTLGDTLAEMCYTRFGVTKEMVDGAGTNDFATTTENHTILFSRRIKVLGKTTSKHATRLVQNILTFDENIQRRLIEILNRHQDTILRDMTDDDKAIFEANYVTFTKMMLSDIISRVRAELPEPDASKITNTKDKLSAYEEVLDITLEYIFSDKFMTPEIAGDLSEHVVALREAWKAELMRRYITNNDILPEVFDIISIDQDGKPTIELNELLGDHVSKLMLSSMDLLTKMKKYRAKADKDLEVTLGDMTDNDSYSSNADDTGSTGGDDPFGSSDDLGGMDDTATPEEPDLENEAEPEEKKPEEETPEEETNKEEPL